MISTRTHAVLSVCIFSLITAGGCGKANMHGYDPPPSSNASSESSPPRGDADTGKLDEEYPIDREYREMLPLGEQEKDGFGVYTYFLFPAEPNERDVYLTILKAWSRTADFDPAIVSDLSLARSNIMYVPVNRSQQTLQAFEEELQQLENKDEMAKKLLENYSFGRAQEFVGTVREYRPEATSDRNRAILVCSTVRLSEYKDLHKDEEPCMLVISIEPNDSIEEVENCVEGFIELCRSPRDWNKSSVFEQFALACKDVFGSLGEFATVFFTI